MRGQMVRRPPRVMCCSGVNKNNKSLLKASRSLMPLSLAIASVSAQASEADTFNLSLEELSQVRITVTSAFPEDYLSASSSASVIGPADWRRLGARRSADVLAALPSTATYSSLGAHAVAIRGFAQSSSVRGIATLLDGVPLNGFAFGSALYDKLQWDLDSLQRMEVIRGPSSALYGSDAFHGVIAMQSYAPEADGQQLTGHLGSDGYWQSSWRGSKQLDSDWRLTGSAAANEKPDEGRTYHYTAPDASSAKSEFGYRDNSQSGILKLESGEIENGRYDLGLYSNQYRADDHPGVDQAFSPGKSLTGAHDFADSKTQFNMLRGRGRWSVTQDQELEVQTYHWEASLDTHLDLQEHPSYLATQLTRTEEQRQGIDVKLKQHLGQHTDWLLMGTADRQHIDNRLTRRTAPAGNLLWQVQEGSDDASRHTLGLANQFKTRLFDDHLTLVYGGRYDEFSDVGSKFTPRLGVILQPDQHSAYKLLYGRAFRAPTAVELYGIATALGDTGLKPEVIDTYEAVYMYQGDNWRSELVGFYSEWRNGIVLGNCTSPNCGALTLEYKNIAESDARGGEWLVEFKEDAWRVQSSLSYTESHAHTEMSDGSHRQTRYSAFPRWMAQLGTGYQWPNQLELYVNNRLHLNATEGVDSPYNHFGEDTLPHYWRTDLHLSQAISPQTRLSADLRNVFGRENWHSGIWNTENGLEDDPRTLTLGISHDF